MYLIFFIKVECRERESNKLIKVDSILKNNYPRLPDEIRKKYAKKIYDILYFFIF